MFELTDRAACLFVRYTADAAMRMAFPSTAVFTGLLDHPAQGIERAQACTHRQIRGWKSKTVAVWLKPVTGLDWEEPPQESFGHGRVLRLRMTERESAVALGNSPAENAGARAGIAQFAEAGRSMAVNVYALDPTHDSHHARQSAKEALQFAQDQLGGDWTIVSSRSKMRKSFFEADFNGRRVIGKISPSQRAHTAYSSLTKLWMAGFRPPARIRFRSRSPGFRSRIS